MFENDRNIDRLVQISAGKYRRYAGLKWYQRWFDFKTMALNVRDLGRLLKGKKEARKLLKEVQPDILLIKGGFVGVPMGLAAARLGIPYITHDSDSIPGLANRLISKKAAVHATGMPAEMYAYPKDKTVYTGIPVSDKFQELTDTLRADYRQQVGLGGCKAVITVIGGSQGGEQLNTDVVTVVTPLLKERGNLGLVHIAGQHKAAAVETGFRAALTAEELKRVKILDFSNELYACSGAADVVISRASATALAEFAVQGLAVIVVPGRLAGGHQDKNAIFLHEKSAAAQVAYGDSQGLSDTLVSLLDDPGKRKKLARNLHLMAKPHAARELAELTLMTAKNQKG